MVHAPGVPPIMSEKGVAVSPGLHNFLPIDVKHVRHFRSLQTELFFFIFITIVLLPTVTKEDSNVNLSTL